MSPLAMIKQGILNKDIKSIIEAYKLLTGEDLAQSKTKPKKEKISPQKSNKSTKPNRPTNPTISKKPPLKSKSDITDQFRTQIRKNDEDGKKYARTEKIKIGKNRFVDNGKLATQDRLREDKNGRYFLQGKHKIYVSDELVQRRDGFQLEEIECQVCGDMIEVNPKLVSGRDFFRCNKCINQAGRIK